MRDWIFNYRRTRGITTRTGGKHELHLICGGETLDTNAFYRHLKEHCRAISSGLNQNTHGQSSNRVENDIFAAISGGDYVVRLNPAPAFVTLHEFIPWFSGSSCLTTTVFHNSIFVIFWPVRSPTLSNIQDWSCNTYVKKYESSLHASLLFAA